MHPHLFSYRCYIQEIMSCLILLSEESWRQRLSYLFDVFKCSGNDEMMYDEVVLAGQVVAMSLYRLWGSSSWDQAEWSHLTEGIADGAYAKVCDALMSSVPLHLKSLFFAMQLEKDLEAGITKEEFVSWAMGRFKESRSVSSVESLVNLFKSPFD